MDEAKRKSNIWRRVILCAVLVCLCLVVVLSCFRGEQADPADPTAKPSGIGDVLKSVIPLKEDLKALLQDVENQEWDAAISKIDALTNNLRAIRTVVNMTLGVLGDNSSDIQKQVANVQNMLDLADMGLEDLLKPAILQFKAYPPEDISADGAINTRYIGEYIRFAQALMPDVEKVLALANQTDLSLIDGEGKLSSYLRMANELYAMYCENEELISMSYSVLGAEEDRVYLIAAQNSTEIRASGGFPGSMGTIRIQDGILTMGDFQTVYDVLATYTPSEATVTAKENKLFHNGLNAPRDADYCPDFERVAYIWSLGYEKKQKEAVDGVISMTPCIVQRLLAVTEREIELFDGTVLNGENATKVLQHDLYFKYFGDEKIKDRADTADELFADAAKKLMDLLVEDLDISDLEQYLAVAQQCVADRTLMLWMKDESLQNLIVEQGWHGGLNTDPMNPQAGVYYSCTVPSKMGWFLVMDTNIGERTRNEDGSYTYPVTIVFSNAITKQEIKAASDYITGGKDGAIVGSAYFFAPAGGSVSDFISSNGSTVRTETYHDLELGYMLNFKVRPDAVITVTYNVTTAPGVETPLVFSKTPTVQDYHEITE